ncbi:MAG TPA: hypothetical protein DD490_01275 [Acidobacteria bacterium]|nr:hypothetical protein [Acidobacteriota bacterium]
MHLDPRLAHQLLLRVDPGRVHGGRAAGLRDGALLSLVAAGLSAAEIVALQATAITMNESKVQLAIHRRGITWVATLPTDLGAWLLAWLTESRLWAEPEPLFRGPRGPLTPAAIHQFLKRYRTRPTKPARRKKTKKKKAPST